jgi:LPXTG-site transpeptidase (sortase) family protein
MLDLEQVARAIDSAVAPVTADEARARAGARTHFRRTAIVVSTGAALMAGAAIVGVLLALGVGRDDRVTVVETVPTTILRPSTKQNSQPPTPTTVRLGDPIGRIVIPKIDVDWVFVEGSRPQDEAKGPMHLPDSATPGQLGNVVIAGHRTTHGAPFNRLNELKPGDVIQITTLAGGFTYIVDRDPFVVADRAGPVAQSVLDRPGCVNTPSLTLITDHPKYSAAQRLVVTAHIGTEPGSSCAQ